MDLKIPPVLVCVVAAILMWLLAQILPDWGALPRSGWLVLLLLLGGSAIAVAGVLVFRRTGTTANPRTPQAAASVVCTGIYRYSRNPMYLGLVLLLAAWAVWLGHVLAWAGVVALVCYLNRFQIRPEEAALSAKFGDSYHQYCCRTRRWL